MARIEILVFYEGAEIYHGNYFAAAACQLNGPVALQDLPVAENQFIV